ncbi:MAG: hypothetical protein ACRDSJ_14600 [Rubrobacteraceae bacterium]
MSERAGEGGERPARRFLRLALSRASRGSGSPANFYNRRTSVQPIPNLSGVLDPLRWALIGGIALRAYAPERMTLDVDIVIHERDAPAARQAFIAANYRIIAELAIGGFSAREPCPDAMPVDVIARKDPWLEDALSAPCRDRAGHPVLARPYLTLLKLQAGRTQDLADVQRLLATTPAAERASTRNLIERHTPDLVEDYDALITLADLEFGDDG